MTKKHEAMKKAKESWKKMIEWWKEMLSGATDIVWWTVWSIWYTLLSAWEKGISTINENRENVEWISATKKKKRRDKAKKYSENAIWHIKKAWKLGKRALSWTWKVLKWWAKTIWHTVKGGYHLIDAWDKAIWEQIEKKQIEKWKKSWKIWRFARNNIAKLMIALGIAWYGWYKATELSKDKQEDKQELVVKDNSEGHQIQIIENPEEYTLSFEERPYFQNPDFFDKNFKPTKDETYKDKWIILIRDAWMTFYVVQKWETKKEGIRKKLSSIPEFSYLADSEYSEKIMWFNVPDKSLKEGLYIPIPLKSADRHIDIDEFREYAKIAVHEMKKDPIYWDKTQKLIKECGEDNVINIMTAFARCETAPDDFSAPIWTAELHRWEPWSEKTPLNAFSFSYYHILMEKNADGKTSWPWLKARENLWLTEWQCYHPINAWKLFLWYCFEKVKSDPTYFFKINNLADAKTKWWKYNWDQNYWNKLRANIKHVKW